MGTDYYVRTNLFFLGKTQGWLIEELAKEGIHVHKSDMSRFLHGKRTGQRADEVLKQSAAIIDAWKTKI